MSSLPDYNFPSLPLPGPDLAAPPPSMFDLLLDATATSAEFQQPGGNAFFDIGFDDPMLFQIPSDYAFDDSAGNGLDMVGLDAADLGSYAPPRSALITDAGGASGTPMHSQDVAADPRGGESPVASANSDAPSRVFSAAAPADEKRDEAAHADDEDNNNTTHASRNPSKPVIALRERELDAATKARYKANGKANKQREAALAKDIAEEAALRARNVKALAEKHCRTVQYINGLLNMPKMVKPEGNKVNVGNVLFSQFSKETNACE